MIAIFLVAALLHLTNLGHAGATGVAVQPKFGGQIIGYDIDEFGTQGILSEAAILPGGKTLAATETFDEKTGKILSVVAKTRTQDDFVTEGVFDRHVALVLHQHAGVNHFLTMDPFTNDVFTGQWTPPIKSGYELGGFSHGQGMRTTVTNELSFTTGLNFVFGTDVAANTFGPLISLAPIINVDEFLFPVMTFDSKTNEAVLADSQGCPEPICTTDIALVNLTTGHIREFSDQLGVGTVEGIAVDPSTGIACVTSSIDQAVQFYDLAHRTGFEVQIPGAGSSLESGLDVEFDRLNHVFLISQYSSNGNPNDPQARIYVYDERGNVLETVPILRTAISPAPIAFNPRLRIGYIAEIVEPQHEFLTLQQFAY